MEELLVPLMYRVPGDHTIEQVLITDDMVKDGSDPQITYNQDRKPVKIKVSTHTRRRRDQRDSAS